MTGVFSLHVRVAVARVATGVVVAGMLMPGLLLAEEGEPRLVPAAAGGVIGSGSILQLLISLLGIVVLILASAWLLRRFSRFGPSQGPIRIIGGLSLGTRERLVLVEVGDTQLVLGVAPGRVERLHVMDEPITATRHAQTDGGGFAERLRVAVQGDKS